MLPNRFPYFCYHVLWDKKEKSTQININYTLEKEISMKKWNFYSNAFYLFIYFFIRFTYFNTVAQTFYILINSQEVSRKSRVSCTSILNLFFFPQCTVTVFALYFTWSIFSRFFFNGMHLLYEEKAKFYLFEFIIFV